MRKQYLQCFFNISKINKKIKQNPINIKNYAEHPHDMMHVPAKFQENKSKHDGQRDGRASRAFGAAGDNNEDSADH